MAAGHGSHSSAHSGLRGKELRNPGLREGAGCPGREAEGWQVLLQQLLVPSGSETSRQESRRESCRWRAYCAQQARYLLKEPAKLGLSPLDVSNCRLLGELEVLGYENVACVQTSSVVPTLAHSCSFWELEILRPLHFYK